MNRFVSAGLLVLVAAVASAAPPAGFTPLFNGRDLSGWQGATDGKDHPGLARTKGHIGFAGHHDEVHFRNIRVKRLP